MAKNNREKNKHIVSVVGDKDGKPTPKIATIKEADIVITISGGAVQGVKKPKGTTLVIRDYDIDQNGNIGSEYAPYCKQDQDGDWFQEMFFDVDSKGDFMD